MEQMQDELPWRAAVGLKRQHTWFLIDKPGHSYDGHLESACGGVYRLPSALSAPNSHHEKCARCANLERMM